MLNSTQAEKPLVIIGEEDMVIGFQALGFKVYPVENKEEFKNSLAEATKENSAVCLVQDKFYLQAEEEVNLYRNRALPVIIPFGKEEKTDLLDLIVKDIRLRATGKY